MIEKTVIEWTYQPSTYFEAAYSNSTSDWTMSVADGKVIATLTAPQDPVDTLLLRAIGHQVGTVFAARQLQTHQPYQLAGPAVLQHHTDGHRVIAVSAEARGRAKFSAKADIVVTRPSGEIIADTRAERIAKDTHFMDLAAKKGQDPLLQSLLSSYGTAVNDPANELVHLYEIRDALSRHFGGKNAALKQLGIPESEWDDIGIMANKEPLKEGRHRGVHVGNLRNAKRQELDKARQIVRGWIERYMLQLP